MFKKNLEFPKQVKDLSCSFWLVVIFLKTEKLKNKVVKFLKKKNIETRPTFYPIHTMPMYKSSTNYKNAMKLSKLGICLPSYPNLKKSEIIKICNYINNIIKK